MSRILFFSLISLTVGKSCGIPFQLSKFEYLESKVDSIRKIFGGNVGKSPKYFSKI